MMLCAAQNYQENIIEALADAGADLDQGSTNHSEINTPLANAIQNNSEDAVKALIRKGATINYNNLTDHKDHKDHKVHKVHTNTMIPMERALSCGGKYLQDLMDAGAYTNFLVPPTFGETNISGEKKILVSPLLIPIKYYNLEIIKTLLKNDADPNLKSDNTVQENLKTPLQFAISMNQNEACKLLIEYGARTDILSSEEKEDLQKMVEGYENIRPDFPPCQRLANQCRRFIRKSCCKKYEFEALINRLPPRLKNYVQNADKN